MSRSAGRGPAPAVAWPPPVPCPPARRQLSRSGPTGCPRAGGRVSVESRCRGPAGSRRAGPGPLRAGLGAHALFEALVNVVGVVPEGRQLLADHPEADAGRVALAGQHPGQPADRNLAVEPRDGAQPAPHQRAPRLPLVVWVDLVERHPGPLVVDALAAQLLREGTPG